MNKFELSQAYELEYMWDWSYVESEGQFAIRFDWGPESNPRSLWVNSDGSHEGSVPNDPDIKNKLKEFAA